MEPEKTSPQIENVDKFANLKKVTPLSKYLALALFIILPFLGGYIGYVLAPEKIVEVEQVVANETRTDAFIEPVITNDSETSETENVIFSELSTNLYLDDLDKDVVLDGKTLFWKREFEDEWDMLVVKNSETLEYSGYGIFSDGVQVYSLGYLEGYEVLDPTKK